MIWGDSYGWRKNTSCETGIIQRYLSVRSSTKTLESIRQNIGQSHALAIRHFVDIVSPTFELGLPCLQSNSLSASSYECSMSIPTYPLAKIGSCYGKLLSWIWQTKFLWLDNLSNNPSWKSGKHGNNIRHSQLIHLPNMSILTMLEAYSNNLHELATVYWGQKKSQIKSCKFNIQLFNHLQMSSL